MTLLERIKELEATVVNQAEYIKDLEARLAAIEAQEPVAWRVSYESLPELGSWFSDAPCDGRVNVPLYTKIGD